MEACNFIEKLTVREKQCLYWAGQDKTLYETAECLCLSPETIKTHRKILLRKLRCKTITGAFITALNAGINIQ